ncbi:NAD(P)-dependent dehydrogenase (short-subunit alcohol dehydrogenase family) [Rhodococcus sp. PvR044]|uniref:SDR family oxidoreductase n=1 Tax=Rhodococcus TaxID=1827 RepID=UPI000BCF465B|nr:MULTISPECIES: SDR family oxidoreductase [Rhodococcus]MBP1160764.1 NAD(P)-dependent dehydrogenase (short-subunit alcohol dehydrogenase family) [Rhodococcus sp. PvR099]MCZ4559083.1 SDR family oxidoreductase [Rhodococcus maanshanensis]PTR36290.1 NAD(P)-dependent dehydrogenase (short-subunit alcohol dehydrogenase family) [Rhodococcus sp. OK611]SNX94046.1 NAD(P)-dependent dehydrogenase, short-chain alcohol dehydrogenase family [Rhodococcus sp. OK270]
MDLGLDGSVVLVTGGVRGVGAGISRAFLRAGATVVTCARRPADEPIEVDGRGVEFISCDLRDAEQVQSMIDSIVATHGRLDAVVNNAGGAPYALAADASPRFHSKIVELNLLAPLLISQIANAVMQKQDTGGSIVMISSVSGSRPSPGTAAYGAAKAGIDSLAASLAVEWAPKVRVNSIVVGLVETEQSHLHYGGADGLAAVSKTVPLGRMARPEDIGNCATFLASPLASYVSGSTLTVHGGGERPAFLAASDAETSNKPVMEEQK